MTPESQKMREIIEASNTPDGLARFHRMVTPDVVLMMLNEIERLNGIRPHGYYASLEQTQMDLRRALAMMTVERDNYRGQVKDAAASARDALRRLSPLERVAFLEEVFDGYCEGCGTETPPRCHCRNDE